MKTTGRIPSGNDLMKTLIDLLADQEGIKIVYELEERRQAHEENGISEMEKYYGKTG